MDCGTTLALRLAPPGHVLRVTQGAAAYPSARPEQRSGAMAAGNSPGLASARSIARPGRGRPGLRRPANLRSRVCDRDNRRDAIRRRCPGSRAMPLRYAAREYPLVAPWLVWRRRARARIPRRFDGGCGEDDRRSASDRRQFRHDGPRPVARRHSACRLRTRGRGRAAGRQLPGREGQQERPVDRQPLLSRSRQPEPACGRQEPPVLPGAQHARPGRHILASVDQRAVRHRPICPRRRPTAHVRLQRIRSGTPRAVQFRRRRR